MLGKRRKGNAGAGALGKGNLNGTIAALLAIALCAPAAATAGKVKPAPAADTRPPETRIQLGPRGALETSSTTVTFRFSASEPATFECAVNTDAFGACSGGTSHAADLEPGSHTFTVRARDLAGNIDPTPAKTSFTFRYAARAAYVENTLLDRATKHPQRKFDVIVQTRAKHTLRVLAQAAGEWGRATREFKSVDAVAMTVPGSIIAYLAENPRKYDVSAITEDAAVKPTSKFDPVQLWPSVVNVDELWPVGTTSAAIAMPAIAIVDSGVDGGRAADFGARVVKSVNIAAVADNAPADENGHGTFVAAVAAGAAPEYPGAAPGANIVSLRVFDAEGKAQTSDVIAAADWLLSHGAEYGVRVANFSLHSARANSFRFDPLDKAVERLWFSGITVVAASGNFGDGGRMQMAYAPGNDPFVITVGAADTMNTTTPADDTIAPWSAYGRTLDGFAKPELVAPGRSLVAAVPPASHLAKTRADRIVSDGYMRLSGTSFAAPIVAGAAAQLLARHPEWGPDDVKGALMLAAQPTAAADPLADGVGELDAAAAAAIADPPNPHAALNRFVVRDATGAAAFDGSAWTAEAAANASWADVTWSDASWADASWADATWSDATWSDASFASATWSDASEADAALADASWYDATWSDATWSDAGR
jgi:serine protease AprX